MNTWLLLVMGWLVVSSVFFIGSFIIAFIKNNRLTNLIKNADYKMWEDFRDKTTVGIKLPFWVFNPFNLPEHLKRKFKNNAAFDDIKESAAKSTKFMFLCFGNLALSIILCVIVLSVVF